ncbi:MAG: Fic family protein [Planctomycetes bacterium]|nr:Fic family protein [Planctomycetota bacterium]
MAWNWQQPDWPRFSWTADRLARAEQQFLLGAGAILGAVSHLDGESRDHLTVMVMSEEAVTTSEIEGEILDRDSVQSSIRRQLGLEADPRPASPAEQGIAEMMVDLYRRSEEALDEVTLCSWHRMLMSGRRLVRDIGRYRTHAEPMQVVSGKIHDPKVHFEAPPSSRVPTEMAEFLDWFNRTAPSGTEPLPALTRAGIAHLYFECIHPFEDGNGRIGRTISEKALAQSLGRPTLTALAATILVRRRSYYETLEASNTRTEISEWLAWFAGIALEAQQRTQARVEFLIDKTKLLDRLRGRLNERQMSVLLRVLQEGPEGFKGGLSAGNYVSIARTSPATATRDLADLVDKGAVRRTGERRHARYHLTIPLRPVARVTIDRAGNIV